MVGSCTSNPAGSGYALCFQQGAGKAGVFTAVAGRRFANDTFTGDLPELMGYIRQNRRLRQPGGRQRVIT